MQRRVIFLYRWPVEELEQKLGIDMLLAITNGIVEGRRTRVATSVVVLF